MNTSTFDAVVVGAGLAGAVAARDLRDRGFSVALIEGADRVGGRLYSRRFVGRSEVIECGGGWVNRDLNPLMSAEIDRYGIEMKDDNDTGAGFAFRRSDGMHRSPVPAEEVGHLEAAWFHIYTAARRISVGQPLHHQALSDLDVSLSDFLAPLQLPPHTRDFLAANLAAFTGAHPDEQSVLWTLSKVAAFGYSLIGLFNGQATWSGHTQMFADGASSLVQAIVDGSGAQVVLGDAAVAVDRDAERVTVTTASGRQVLAQTCVLALPTNVIRQLKLTPPLAHEKQQPLAQSHVGRAIKVYAVVDGVEQVDVCLGAGPFQMVLPAARLGEREWLVTCFGAEPVHHVEPTSIAEVQDAVRWYYPNARVTAVDGHDWNADPLYDGTYRINQPGQDISAPRALSAPEERLVLANSEIDLSIWRNSMEGAVHSGKVAAAHLGTVLA